MKLKKVTALLLATSMVLSSVSVASFADEEIVDFGAEYQSEDNASDEVNFGDDVVVEEQNEEDGAADESFFADEVVGETAGDTVVDDVIVEDSADDQETLAFEGDTDVDKPTVDENADIYAAIASADVSYDTTVVTSPVITPQEFTYTGKPVTLNVDGVKALGEPVLYCVTPLTGTKTEVDNSFTTNLDDLAYYLTEIGHFKVWVAATLKDSTPSDPKYSTPEAIEVEIKQATVTATLNPGKSFVFGNFDGSMDKNIAMSDFTVTGIPEGVALSSVLSIPATMAWSTLDVNVDGTATDIDKADVGSYPVDETTLAAIFTKEDTTNYKYEFVTNDVKINPLKVNLRWSLSDGINPAKGNAKEIGYVYGGSFNATAEINPAVTGASISSDYDGDTAKTTVGKYSTTAKIKNSSGTDITKNCEITNGSWDWEVTKADLMVSVNAVATPATALNYKSVYYGTTEENVLKALNGTDLTYYSYNKATQKWEQYANTTDVAPTGKAKYRTNYVQYDPAGTTRSVWYDGGLTSTKYNLITYENLPGKFIVVPVPVVLDANTIIASVYDEPVDVTDKYTVKNGKDANSKEIADSADALNFDIKNEDIKVTLKTKPAKPSAVGKYPIEFTLTNGTSKKSIQNYVFTTASNTGVTAGSTDSKITIEDKDKYQVVKGEFKLEVKDNKVKYDGKEHGVVLDPEQLPSNIVIYYASDDASPFADPTTGSAHDNKAAASFMADSKVSTNMPTRTETGTTRVYFLVTSTDYDDLAAWGTADIEILGEAEADAAEVEKIINEATKRDAEGKLDPEKVKEAREAYDALSKSAKGLVSTAAKKKLEDAEKEISGDTDAKAAKAVEDEIDKLPAATEATAKDKEAADKAVEDYNKLTDAQKALVPADKVKKMNDVKAAADAAGEDADKKAAKAVEDEIAALPAAADAKASDKAAADKAKADYDALTDAQKALVPADAVDKMNAVKAAADAAAEEDEKAEKERELFDEAVALVKAQKSGVDGKNAADNAKKAYENLSDAAKAKLTDEEIDAYEDTQKAYAKNFTFNSGEGVFKVLGNGEVTYFKPLHPENTWFVVPNMVKKNGFVYKVIKVSTKAFMGCVNATKIKIGKNVQVIGEYAFKNTPAMTKLIMLTSKLASGKVQNSFVAGGKDKGAKLTNYVPSGKSSAYDSLFKGEGGMNAGAKFTEEN